MRACFDVAILRCLFRHWCWCCCWCWSCYWGSFCCWGYCLLLSFLSRLFSFFFRLLRSFFFHFFRSFFSFLLSCFLLCLLISFLSWFLLYVFIGFGRGFFCLLSWLFICIFRGRLG